MNKSKEDILKNVNDYYTQKVITHGISPAGVDWNSKESQELRFDQLLKVIKNPEIPFDILDYGCGFGSMYEYTKNLFPQMTFLGFDISEEMIKKATELFPINKNLYWKTSLTDADKKDYVIASGIFNVKQENDLEGWQSYILDTLHQFNQLSNEGFSFNVLTKYSDKEYMKEYLYYADPLFLFDYCKKNFSRNVALLHDYDLYEFTILVKK
jgi:SAM-dependent methyltransferase